jgi:hypothetical protein
VLQDFFLVKCWESELTVINVNLEEKMPANILEFATYIGVGAKITNLALVLTLNL